LQDIDSPVAGLDNPDLDSDTIGHAACALIELSIVEQFTHHNTASWLTV